jgi:hypothetical protein
MGWTTGRSRFDPRQRRKDSSSSLCVQTGSGAHRASCTMGTGGPFPGAKARPARDVDHSPHQCRDQEWARAISPLPPSASIACSGTALTFCYLCDVCIKSFKVKCVYHIHEFFTSVLYSYGSLHIIIFSYLHYTFLLTFILALSITAHIFNF